MDNEPGKLSAWEETGAVIRPAAWDQRSTPQTAFSPEEAFPLRPASDAEWITTLTPCLQLVAPVGMSEEAQETWFEAARLALGDVPPDLLKRGALAAMHKADHPSKIIPAIHAEIGDALAARCRTASIGRPVPALPAPVETEEQKRERLEVAEMMERLARRLDANTS